MNCSEIQPGLSSPVSEAVDACAKNKVALKGIISTPLNYTGSILQTVNMKLRYIAFYIECFKCYLENLRNPIVYLLVPQQPTGFGLLFYPEVDIWVGGRAS